MASTHDVAALAVSVLALPESYKRLGELADAAQTFLRLTEQDEVSSETLTERAAWAKAELQFAMAGFLALVFFVWGRQSAAVDRGAADALLASPAFRRAVDEAIQAARIEHQVTTARRAANAPLTPETRLAATRARDELSTATNGVIAAIVAAATDAPAGRPSPEASSP